MSSLSDLEPRGLVHLYTGDGKGKTTAAAGLSARALGTGKSVLFCQFLKGRESGECKSLEALGAKVLRPKSGGKFVSKMNVAEREDLCRNHALCVTEIESLMSGGGFDLIVLDEIIDAVNLAIIPEGRALALMHSRPAHVELVLTGRKPGSAFVDAADYHTDFVCLKHPYKCGITARRGIEY